MKLMRRNLLAIVPAALLSIIGQSAYAAAGPTIKATKVGQRIVFRGYTYVCIKSKGRLVWKKGAKVVPPSTSASPSPSPSQFQSSGALVFVAKADDVSEGETKIVSVKPVNAASFPVSVSRGNGAIVVLSAICTHNGCVVEADKGRLLCPCHGSAFNALSGAVNQGPAKSALRKYVASEDAGSIFIKI